MSKDNRRSVLGSEFVQFLGGSIDKLTAPGAVFEGRPQAAAHEVIAVVAEELLKLTYDKDGDIDFFRAKPLVRAAIFLVKQYRKDIEGADLGRNLKKFMLDHCDDAETTLNTMTDIEEDLDVQ